MDYVKNFRPTPIWEFGDDEEKVNEHKQVRNALYNFGERTTSFNLAKLAKLRKKADYDPFLELTPKNVSDAIGYMEKIFNHLKF